MDYADIAGVRIPMGSRDTGWIPRTNLILTPTTVHNLQKILYPLRQGYNLLLVGDAGVGKNALIYYINQIRRNPTIRYSFNEDTLPEDLVGSYRIDPLSHSFVWSDGPLSHALRTGATFVADEMNLAPPEVLKRFYSVFTDGYLQLLEGDSTFIRRAEKFNFVATQNPAEGFEGRKNLPREIQKYFATIFIDPYPHSEQVEILRGLNPSLPQEVLECIVNINSRVEELILLRKIGSRDLERYHFNLRNLNRLAARIQDGPHHLLAEIFDIYVRPFRLQEDREKIIEIVNDATSKIPGYESTPVLIEKIQNIAINADKKKKQLEIGRSRLTYSKTQAATEAGFAELVQKGFRLFPPVSARLSVMEAIARCLEKSENILLECESDVEPEEYVRFFSRIMNKELTVITLSRGMHTADILGGLKPACDISMNTAAEITSAIGWVDGPLTAAVRKGGYILLKGLEAAGPELVEKLNMLTDDARALLLPPESGTVEPLILPEDSRIFALKFFRNQRSTPSISRAFRNRFSSIIVPPLTDADSLKEIVQVEMGLGEETDQLSGAMVSFHALIRERSFKRDIGSANLQPYYFGLTNLVRWCEHIKDSLSEKDAPPLKDAVLRGCGISYINEISDPSERKKMYLSLEHLLSGVTLDEVERSISEALKKKGILQKSYFDKINWDPEKHKREANTGKAKWKINGDPIKNGININTPETGGNTKEGEDAWYGSDTRGNLGQGEPGHGGGGWGYRTEELYKEFLKKRKALWEYNIGATLEDFNEVFGAHIQKVAIDFDRLLDPQVDISRRYMSQGSRVDTRRYLSYLAGKGDGRVFDKTTVTVEEDRLKGVEVILAVNKGRRIFNFEYSIATLVSLMSLAAILNNHSIPFGIAGYSDLTNEKRVVDISWFKHLEEPYLHPEEEKLFYGLARSWHGDTVAEHQIMDELCNSFTPAARTRILVFVSDFRGARGKLTIEKDMASNDTVLLKQGADRLTARGIIVLGVGTGPRAISAAALPESLTVSGENFANLPSLLSSTITDLIHKHHNAAVL